MSTKLVEVEIPRTVSREALSLQLEMDPETGRAVALLIRCPSGEGLTASEIKRIPWSKFLTMADAKVRYEGYG